MDILVNSTVSEEYETYVDRNIPLYSTGKYPPMPPMPQPPKDLLYNFKKYANLITCIVGIIGNLIIFLIFTRTKLKKPSSARYLAAAAVADSGYLFGVLCVNLDLFYKVRLHRVVGPCQLLTFGDHAFSFLSRWYLTAVIIEKYIGVTWPRKKSKMCTVFRAKCVIICLAIISIVCYLYLTWFFGVYGDPPVCFVFYGTKQVVDSWKILTRMDAIVNFVVPYLIIFFLTCLIAYKSWEYHKQSLSASERFLRRRRVTTPGDKEFKMTPLLILLASCTLILSVPNSIIRLQELSGKTYMPTEGGLLLMNLFVYFVYLNSAIKIFIYLIASSAFAREIGRVCCVVTKMWKKSEDSELQTRNMTANLDGGVIKSEVTAIEGRV